MRLYLSRDLTRFVTVILLLIHKRLKCKKLHVFNEQKVHVKVYKLHDVTMQILAKILQCKKLQRFL